MAGMNDILTMDRLPAMPAAMAKAVPLLLDPETPWEALEKVIRQDESMTSSVLRLANSATYGSPGKQFDLRRAMSRLGRDALRRCVIGQHVSGVVAGDNAAFGLQRGALWRSSLGGAIAAEELARRFAPDDASLAFVCGLLRDIGKLALNVHFGAHYYARAARSSRRSDRRSGSITPRSAPRWRGSGTCPTGSRGRSRCIMRRRPRGPGMTRCWTWSTRPTSSADGPGWAWAWTGWNTDSPSTRGRA
jgi:HDOD domain